MATEIELLALLQHAKILYAEISERRPKASVADEAFDDALGHLDETISALGLAVYLATEGLADDNAVEGGEADRLPNGDIVPKL